MQVDLMQLWLPILLGGVLCWVASALIHMLIKWHNADYTALSNEDEVMAAIANSQRKPALYTFPYCKDMKDMGTEAMQQKFANGPVGMLTLFPDGMPPMGKLMTQQLLFFIVSCLLIAYLAALALPAGAEYLTVFRFVAVAGFVAFGLGGIPDSIWYGHPWPNTFRFMGDALIYGLVVAGTFAWLWPAAG